MYDANYFVARAAMNSAGTIGGDDFLYVPTLVSADAQPAAQGPGPQGAGRLRRGRGRRRSPTSWPTSDEDIWVRRHVPVDPRRAFPAPASVEALLGALDDPDGFLRFKAVAALDAAAPRAPGAGDRSRRSIERHVSGEAGRAFDALTLYTNLFVTGGLSASSLLARALGEKREPGDEPGVPAARPGPPARRHRGGRAPPCDPADARHRIRTPSSCSTTCSPARCAAA